MKRNHGGKNNRPIMITHLLLVFVAFDKGDIVRS